MIFKPHDYINFGKNAGKLLSEIYQYQPSYLEYLILKSEKFKIDIQAFEKLPTPTTIGYRENHFNNTIDINQDVSDDEIWNFIINTDTTNHFYNVDQIKELIDQGAEVDSFTEFKFPAHIVEYNNSKK